MTEFSYTIQLKLSTADTTGTQLAVLYREVSLIRRKVCTQLYITYIHICTYVVGTADSVGIERCPMFRVAGMEEEVSLDMGSNGLVS